LVVLPVVARVVSGPVTRAAADLATVGSDAERCATGRRTAAVVLPAPATPAFVVFAEDSAVPLRLVPDVAGVEAACLERLVPADGFDAVAPAVLRAAAGTRGFTIPASGDDFARPVADDFPLTALVFRAGWRTAAGSAAPFFPAAFPVAAAKAEFDFPVVRDNAAERGAGAPAAGLTEERTVPDPLVTLPAAPRPALTPTPLSAFTGAGEGEPAALFGAPFTGAALTAAREPVFTATGRPAAFTATDLVAALPGTDFVAVFTGTDLLVAFTGTGFVAAFTPEAFTAAAFTAAGLAVLLTAAGLAVGRALFDEAALAAGPFEAGLAVTVRADVAGAAGAAVERVAFREVEPEEVFAAMTVARLPVPDGVVLRSEPLPSAAGPVEAFLAAGIEVFLLAND
jgi:hypothetical protein